MAASLSDQSTATVPWGRANTIAPNQLEAKRDDIAIGL
jgi:hypothetical protein